MRNIRSPFLRKAVALALAEVMAISSMLWAAPPKPRYAGPPPNRTSYVPEEPLLVKLARAYEEMRKAASALEGFEPAPVIVQDPPPPEPEPAPQLIAAFAFGADKFTRRVANEPSVRYTKIKQRKSLKSPKSLKSLRSIKSLKSRKSRKSKRKSKRGTIHYSEKRGYGYTDLDGLDLSPNKRKVFRGPDKIYDQFIGAEPGGADIVFRADVPNGTYRFVAAGGDAKNGDHHTTLRARDGGNGSFVTLVENFLNPDLAFWNVGFDDKHAPASSKVELAPETVSPRLTVTEGYIEIHQIAGVGFVAGGDLSLLELWRLDESTGPPPTPTPPGERAFAFTFGADTFTLPGYTKIVQDGQNFLYASAQGFGYSDISGLDTSPNNRGVFSGLAEIYDQFIGAEPGGSHIVFRVDLPNGFYRLVAAGGDARDTDHKTSLHVQGGADAVPLVLVDGHRNEQNEFFQVGFDGLGPPEFDGVRFAPLLASPLVEVTEGFLEVHQIADDGFPAGGDLSVLEIWAVDPPPERLTAAFAFGADGYTRSYYTKIVQDGANFLYRVEQGFGYSDVSGLDTSPNNRDVLTEDDELYDQFIGAAPGGSHIVFRVDVPPGDYRFVAAGGDIRDKTHKTTIEVSDGSTTPITLVENIENRANEFYRVGFEDKHAPSATDVPFLLEVESPTLTVTQGFIEIHQRAGEGFAAGGDLSIFEIWQASIAVPPPTVTIELPEDGGFHPSADVPVRVSFTDADTLQILIDGLDRSSELVDGNGTLDVLDGDHRLEAIVTNAAGTATATRSFTVDTEAPVLELDPVDAYVATTPLTVTGTLRDRDPGATVDCPAAALTPSGENAWSFTCAFPLNEGPNTINVTASDTGGREVSAGAATTLDTVPPELTILSPTPDFYTNVQTISVSGGVFDDTPVTVVANSVPADVTGTSFSANGVSIQDGSNLISIVATDAAGNTREESLTVFFDIDPPTVTLSSPPDGAITLSPITVSGTVSDPAGVVLVNVNGQAVMADAGSFTTTLTAVDGPLTIVARAQDTAGNEGEARANVTVDSTPPALDITSPADGTITALSPITLDGSVSDATAVTLTLNGADVGDAFPIEATLAEGANTLDVGATDAAGNHASASIDVVLDTIAPNLQVFGPSESAVLDLPVILTGTVNDATAVVVSVNGQTVSPTGSAWQLELDFLPEQAHALEIVATDAAGNSASVTRNIFVDFTAPKLTITSPATNILTNQATVDISGTVEDSTAVLVTVNGVPASVSPGIFVATIALVDGDNPIRVVATDEGGRSTEASVIVTQDALPPALELNTPDTISGITPGEITANVTDNLELDSVVMRVNGVVAGTFASPPFALELAVPDGALPGDTVLVRLEATDTAGNTASTARGVIVIEDGVIVGQVLSDRTSLPIEGATVTLGSRSVETGPNGEYSIPTGDAEVVLFVHKNGMTSAERRTSVLSDVGTVPVDVRLTPRGTDVVTPLSAQGLPALLPLGWAPRAAFHIADVPATATASGIQDAEVHVAQYSFSLHEWVLVASGLIPTAREVSFDVPEAGSYAFLVADEELIVPAVGEMLEGVDVAILPASAVAEGVVTPPILPPGGGIAKGELTLLSPIPLPSGTVIQAEITETFSLTSGETASEEIRYEDIVLFRNIDGVLEATFPIASALTEELRTAAVVAGEVNLDILAGREAVRGVRAGSRAATVEEGDFRLAVPSGALPEDTAIDLQTFDTFSDFVPSDPGVEPLAELFVDLSGQTLALGAELSVGVDGLSPSDVYALVRVTHIHGVPRLEFVTLAGLQADRLVAPGVREEGRYLFYRLLSPVGFVSGTTSPPSAIVETAGLPFISQSDGTGQYTALALTGPVTVTASIPRTSLLASQNVDVNDGQTTALDLTLQGQVTNATVTPVDGTLGVSVSTQITITSTTALNAASLDAVRLLDNGDTVPAHLALSGSGKTLAVIPDENLKFDTDYTLEAISLADIFGGAVSVPETSFTTRAKEALSITAEALSLSLPDDNGIVQVSADGLPPGTTVLLVNAGNGIVLSLTVDNNGNLQGELPASISDRILITLTDPAGSSVSFEKSKFAAPDGTTGIGPGGGTVEGPGGVELRIPEGALEQGVTLKIESFDENFLPPDQKPDLPNANFGAGLKVTSEDMPKFEKEVKLAFPKPPDAPDGAFYYVYRKFETNTGIVQWETIDHAFVEDDKVVTASFPFAGFISALAVTSLFVLVWTHDVNAPNLARTGTVTGRVLRTVFQPRSTAPSFVPIPGVVVQAVSGFGVENGTFAISQADGTYTFFDETFRDGIVEVQATVDDVTQTSTAFAINVTDDGDSQLRFYQNVATANLTFPSRAPAPPPPAIDVVILKRNPDDTKERTDGLVVEDDLLTIGFVTTDFVQRASINGETFNVRRDDADERFDWVLEQEFTPGRAGTFLIEVTALSPDGFVVDVAVTFRAIAAGGSNNDVLNNEPPSVITLKTVPKNEAKGIPVSIFPQITFTEPVTNIPGNVTLVDANGEEVGLTLSGVGPDGPIAPIDSAGAKVSSLTLIPITGLKFGERYTLNLSSAIEDLDTDVDGNPAPKSLVPFTTSFTTFGPESLGGTEERFGSAGIAVLGDRAYLVENNFYFGTLRVFDVTDPVNPFEFPEAQASVDGRPVDIVGEDQIIAIATGPASRSRPSNLYFFDVSSERESRWIGAATVAASAADGFVSRIRLLDGVAYALTGRKGVQVIDVTQATDLFQDTIGAPFSSEYFSVLRRLNTAGQGFGQEAVSQAIPLTKDATRDFFQTDLATARIGIEVWAGTTGEAPLYLVNPVTRATTGSVPVETIGEPASIMTIGAAIEMGQVGGRDVALIAGWGSVGGEPPAWAFAVVDISTPSAPTTLDIIALPLDTAPTDILLTGNTAIVASENQAALVNVANPEKPVFAGTIEMIGGVLALSETGLLLSTGRSAFGGDTDNGGVRTALLATTAIVERTMPRRIVVDLTGRTAEPLGVDYALLPTGAEADSAELQLLSGTSVLQSFPVALSDGRGSSTIPLGTRLPPGSTLRLVVNRETPNEIAGPRRRVSQADMLIVPNDILQLSIDEPELQIVAYSDAHLGRSLESLAPTPTALQWEVLGEGGGVTPQTSVSTSGIFETLFRAPPTAGRSFRIQVRLPGSGPIAISEEIQILVGRAAGLELTPSRTALPADEASQVTLTLSAADSAGNPVEDGTPVSWVLSGPGRLQARISETTSGSTSMNYVAGHEAGEAVVTASVDDAVISTTLTLAPIEITVTPAQASVPANAETAVPITISATSAAGPPSDDAELVVQGTLGLITSPASLTSGKAVATFRPIGVPGRAAVWASVASQRTVSTIELTAPTGTLVAFPERPGFVGNRTEGGAVTFEDLTGALRTASYSTSTNLQIQGAPGETVDLRLGGTTRPNVEPVAWYPMDSLENGSVFDEYGDHSATVSPTGVELDLLNGATGAGSFRFDGSGQVIVPDDAALNPLEGVGFGLQFQISSLQSATLLAKGTSYGLGIAPEGAGVRVRAFVTTNTGSHALVSDVLGLNEWHSVSAMFENGILSLNVDGHEQRTAASGSLIPATGPVRLGTGFAGNLDDVRLFDLSGPKLVAFEGGRQTTSVVLGLDGRASVPLLSLGNLRSTSPNGWGTEVKYKIRDSAIDEESSIIWVWTVELFISVLQMGEGAVLGEPESAEAFVGDIIVSFFIVGDVRDLIIALYRIAKGTETTFDYFVLALALIGIATTVTIVGDVVVSSLKNAVKLLRTLPNRVQKLFGEYFLEVLREFVRGRGRQALNEFVTFFRAILKPGVFDSLRKIAKGLDNVGRVRQLIRLASRADDAAAFIRSLGKAEGILVKKFGDDAGRHVANLIDILGHHGDEVAKLGKTAKTWGDDAIQGTAHFLSVTAGVAGDAKKILTTFAKQFPANPKAGEEWFRSINKIINRFTDVSTSGLKQFLTKPARNALDVRGSYGVLRLVAEAP
ncbi:MAG: hypothetical protein E2P02_29310, partial [Acidobacteria bacterium]